MPREFKQNETVVVALPAKLYHKDAEGVTFIRGTYDAKINGKNIVQIHLYGGNVSVQELSDSEVYSLQEIGTASAGIIKEATHTNPNELDTPSEG